MGGGVGVEYQRNYIPRGVDFWRSCPQAFAHMHILVDFLQNEFGPVITDSKQTITSTS